MKFLGKKIEVRSLVANIFLYEAKIGYLNHQNGMNCVSSNETSFSYTIYEKRLVWRGRKCLLVKQFVHQYGSLEFSGLAILVILAEWECNVQFWAIFGQVISSFLG